MEFIILGIVLLGAGCIVAAAACYSWRSTCQERDDLREAVRDREERLERWHRLGEIGRAWGEVSDAVDVLQASMAEDD